MTELISTLNKPRFANSLHTTPQAGTPEYDGTVFYLTTANGQRGLLAARQSVRADTPFTLTNGTGAQPIFTSANDALTVVAGASYRFRCVVRLTVGSTSASLS